MLVSIMARKRNARVTSPSGSIFNLILLKLLYPATDRQSYSNVIVYLFCRVVMFAGLL